MLRHRDKCFRRANLFKLGDYQGAAWSEIRYGVMSTLGCRLSVDLMEVIFERALEVEGDTSRSASVRVDQD